MIIRKLLCSTAVLTVAATCAMDQQTDAADRTRFAHYNEQEKNNWITITANYTQKTCTNQLITSTTAKNVILLIAYDESDTIKYLKDCVRLKLKYEHYAHIKTEDKITLSLKNFNPCDDVLCSTEIINGETSGRAYIESY